MLNLPDVGRTSDFVHITCRIVFLPLTLLESSQIVVP
jgi:hypothetical protein